ncbi:integrase [Streptomyces sp. WMMC897]|uniref:integrase n=1 Tax=Streptomyces sp. WMMC897 TaxID=3014782 RepID=UPI0022B7127F|nr:integrase [Streptomyces sp. WMMC897]MCZ7413097.1 integrase [Streptomyces sp. WMMC897]MCZ7413161.1 integrase [Streptomyces sp. WMMC897]MCZ7415519.1 integrase [Streptomyces sp. WMMC897]
MPYIEWRGNKCRVRWDTGRVHPDTGKKIYDSKSGFTDEDEAYNYGLDRESDVRNDRYISRRDGAVLMKDYCRTWPDTLEVGHLREKNIRSMLRLYIVPRWGDTAVGDIKPSAYRVWKKQLKAMPNVGEKYGEEILTVFSMLMDDAVEDELRPASPVPKTKRHRGKYKKKPREKKREMLIQDVHQLACNALTFWGFPGFVFCWTVACTGMRPAEVYALRREFCTPAWPASDPDAERRAEAGKRYAGESPMPAVRVQWQHQRENGVLKLFPPKYESHRDLVVPPFLAELLAMLLDTHDEPWMFPSIGGSPLANANFTYHYWRPIADGRESREAYERTQGGRVQHVGSRRPVPAIPATAYAGKRLYLLRHGHKEWLDEDGHSRIATETRMGHEVAGVEGLYANVTPVMERRIMDSLQRRWERFVATLEDDWMPSFPSPLPVDLSRWMKEQVKAAQDRES